ncbi:MAG TPA: hypothetical protein VF881_02755, partial [Polyangiaceae bacterium]
MKARDVAVVSSMALALVVARAGRAQTTPSGGTAPTGGSTTGTAPATAGTATPGTAPGATGAPAPAPPPGGAVYVPPYG